MNSALYQLPSAVIYTLDHPLGSFSIWSEIYYLNFHEN
jgi:hypothetical protein